MEPTARSCSSQRYSWLPGLIIAQTSVLVVAIFFTLSIVEDRLIAQAGRDLERTAREVAEKLDLLLFERYGDIQLLAGALAEIRETKRGGEWTALLKKAHQAYPMYAWMGVLNADGRVVAATDGATIGLDFGRKSWFRGLAAGPALRAHYVEPHELTTEKDYVEFSASVRIPGEAQITSDPVQMLVVTRFLIAELSAIVTRTLREIEAQEGYTQGLEFHILTTLGRVISETAPHPAESVNLIDLGVESARMAVSGRTGFVQETHRRRLVPVLTGYARMPARKELDALGWGVLVRMDREAVLAPIRSTLWTVAIGGGCLFFPLWGGLLWSTHQLRRHWQRAETAQQASTESLRFLQSSLDALTSHLAILDEHGTILAVNRAWKAFGDQNQLCDTEHGVGKNYLDICESSSGEGGEEAHRVAQGIRAVLQGQQNEWVGEYPCHGPDAQRWFLVRISKFTISEQVRVVVDHQNITENRVAFRALQESQAATRAIVSSALDAHIAMDQDGMIVGWSAKAEEVFGWAAHEAAGQPLANLIVPPGYREAHERGLKRFLVDGAGLMLGKRLEIEGWHKEGRPFPIELTIAVIKQSSGYLFSAFARDLTERKKQERCQAAEHAVTQLLVEADSLEGGAPDILKTIGETLGWAVGALWRVDEDRQELRCAGTWADAPVLCAEFLAQTRKSSLAKGIGLPGRVWESRRAAWISDVAADENFPRVASASAAGLHAAFAYPILLHDKDYGIIEFFTKDILAPDQPLLNMFDSLTGQVSQFLARRAAEEAVHARERQVRSIIETSVDGIIVIDDHGVIELVNPALASMFGYAPNELVGESIKRLMPSPDREQHDGYLERYRQTGVKKVLGVSRETLGLRKDGTTIPIELTTSEMQVGRNSKFTAAIRNISARKQVEQEMVASQNRAEQAVREKVEVLAAVDAFFICVNLDGAVTEWAGKSESLFGVSLSDAIGRPLPELPLQRELLEAMQKAMQEVSGRLAPVRMDKIRMIHEGKDLFLKFTVTPLCDDRGIGYVFMGEDVTERLRLEHDLAQAQKLESIGQLAAGIAHEINTPTQFVGDNVRFLSDSFTDLLTVLAQHRDLLTTAKAGSCTPAVIAACDAADEQADLDYLVEEIPKALMQSADGVERIAKIVRAMKDFAHPGSAEKTPADLNHAIESTVTVAHNEWKYVADLTTDLAPDLPLVPCLLGPFNQVILNLIVNAAHAISDVVKGTGQKGVIAIATRHVGERVEIRITDSGTGIPEAIRPKIFDPFFTTKAVGTGTGQGLAIARSVVVDKHGGTIAVESQVGTGTTFVIHLPVTVPTNDRVMEEAA